MFPFLMEGFILRPVAPCKGLMDTPLGMGGIENGWSFTYWTMAIMD